MSVRGRGARTSVVFGVDRPGVGVAIHTTTVATVAAAAVGVSAREVRYVAAAFVVDPSGRKLKTRNRLYVHSCRMSPREILAVINWLDLHTLESAALHG